MKLPIVRATLASLFALITIAACANGSSEAVAADAESVDFTTQRYVEHTAERFAEASEFRRVYFFHASWCPTCRGADRKFSDAVDQIPDGVVLFKIDYDKNVELRRDFAVTYQHTFVLVDDENNVVRKWNGGDVEQLVENVNAAS